uniref:Uncharacterized protein LOC108046267 n=1 Tax=Drosophila rhopaloa TaxID=1041015 RepID=A0A6P4EX82_DRORH
MAHIASARGTIRYNRHVLHWNTNTKRLQYCTTRFTTGLGLPPQLQAAPDRQRYVTQPTRRRNTCCGGYRWCSSTEPPSHHQTTEPTPMSVNRPPHRITCWR